ncbi:hypothetical protein T492DRAFT_584597, partial [Pavlovales sp. CCMP2436]
HICIMYALYDRLGVCSICSRSGLGSFVCMYICMHACMYVCMHACMYVCMYVCTHFFLFLPEGQLLFRAAINHIRRPRNTASAANVCLRSGRSRRRVLSSVLQLECYTIWLDGRGGGGVEDTAFSHLRKDWGVKASVANACLRSGQSRPRA